VKQLKYIGYFILSLLLLVIVLMAWPKGTLESQMAYRNVPALGYAVVENGEAKSSAVIGELEKGIPAPYNTIFNVASVTKPVFGLVILKLIDAKVIGLDEPLYPLWVDPDIQDDPRHKLLTPRILLSHQSGFPNWRWHNEGGKLAFINDPGTQYGYSGEGMDYLMHAIEQKTQTSIIQLADSLLFNPLGMTDTRFVWDKDMDEGRFAKWHNKIGGQYELNKRSNPTAADDLMTTVGDMVKFVQYILDGAGLSKDLFAEMTTPQILKNKRNGFGLSWELALDMPNDEIALVHGGSDMGVKARILAMPNSKQGFIAFTNGDYGQQIIDRLMVKEFVPGSEILKRIYTPVIWRIIDLPFIIPL